ncbi:unnamed protein product [Schistosoma margrebowiei]|uniref:Uncharacterized protein n=1 Tax=Schistosoma margrebowiei TaxID=48269 RepID=A0A183LF38_9TREM|nr:unnamed protein product [Schistosoma margrebowiei]
MSQIALEMREYNFDVLGISETYWTQARQHSLDTWEMLLYSGHKGKNAARTQGFSLMLSKETRDALIGWKSHRSRIIKASFKTKKEGITMNVVQFIAPTNYSNDDNKDQFYDMLQLIIAKRTGKYLTILMWDLNAKVVMDNIRYENVM